MKVLILTGRFGMGHVSAAKSLQEQILRECEDASAEVVDLMEYTLPHLSGLIYSGFTFLTKHGRSLYNFLYRQAAKHDEAEWTAFTALSMRKLVELVEEGKPDVVISTLPMCSLLVSKYKEKNQGKNQVTLVTCITDISSHSEWVQPNTDYYLVGGDLVKRQLMSKGVSAEQIVITGIPVREAFLWPGEGRTDSELFGETVKKNLLIMGGGLGLLPKTQEFYRELNSMEGVHTTVITGKNEKLYHMLKDRFENVTAVAFTDQVDQYMKKADVILTKPGGITLFEVIFSGKPLLMFAPFLQQEVNNMHFALYNGIGWVLPKKQAEWFEEIRRVMYDQTGISQMTDNVKSLRQQYKTDGLRRILTAVCENNERGNGGWMQGKASYLPQ